ncbi:hypothetical protein BGX23_008988 [Mortierella sp. AD031]|nr:hypothetical protein BGX23_008988 [Mortierella sp. AD031]
MTIQGVYLEPVRLRTNGFKEFDQRFGHKLVSLYEINYAEVIHGYLGIESEWDDTTYYHGTSHCGCLDQRIANPENNRIPVYSWCEAAPRVSSTAAFSRPRVLVVKTARSYATTRGQGVAPNSNLLSIFVCVTRNAKSANMGPGHEDYHSVKNDNEILPVFVAIVRK